jgi:hypothetical protein
LPAPEDLESAYHIAGPKQFKGRLRDVFLILTDDHFKKPTGDAMPSLSEPFVIPRSTPVESQPSSQPSSKAQAQFPPPRKASKRKNSSGYMTVEGVHKLSRM